MELIKELTWVNWVAISFSILIVLVTLGYFIGYFGAYGLTKALTELDKKILDLKIDIVKSKIKSLDNIEYLNKEISDIRLLEMELNVKETSFESEMEDRELNLTKLGKNGRPKA